MKRETQKRVLEMIDTSTRRMKDGQPADLVFLTEVTDLLILVLERLDQLEKKLDHPMYTITPGLNERAWARCSCQKDSCWLCGEKRGLSVSASKKDAARKNKSGGLK